MYYFLNGQIQNICLDGAACQDVEGTSGAANSETFTSFSPITVGTYVIDFEDWRYEDIETVGTYPQTTCFDFTVTPAP